MSIPQEPRAQVCAPTAGAGPRAGLGGRRGVGPAVMLAFFHCVGALGLGLAPGCSDDAERRDQNYGTDAGTGYHLPKDGSADVSDASTSDAQETATPDPGDAVAPETDAAAPTPDAPLGGPADAESDGSGDDTLTG